MKLSLSVRIAEPPKQKDIAAIPIDVLAPRAKALGFDGISMRASVLSVDSSAEDVHRVRQLLDQLDLSVSMVSGDVPLASNDANAIRALRNITPYLDLADGLGSGMVRVMMHSDEDVAFAQRAADEAAERGLRLVHLTHWGTMFETVEESLETLAAVGRDNFGVAFEPANLLACGGGYGPDALERLAPHLFNVFYSSATRDPSSPMTFNSRLHGPVHMRFTALDDPDGIPAAPLVDRLRETGYDGWFTVHQPLRDNEDADDAMRAAADLFRGLIAKN